MQPYTDRNTNDPPGIIAKTKHGHSLPVGHTARLAYLRKEGYEALLANGQPYDDAQYRELGAAIGDTYGTDKSTGLPLLPDLRGK